MQVVKMLSVSIGPGAILSPGAIVRLPDSVAEPLIKEGKAIRIGEAETTVETAALQPSPQTEFRRKKRRR